MPLSNIVRVSHHHITYVGYGDFNTKGKCTIDKLFTVGAFKLNQGVTTTKLLASDEFLDFTRNVLFESGVAKVVDIDPLGSMGLSKWSIKA
ncbi:hypothetical protein T07_926 [Trichinella nelsoni]|uniref:Uncharacterized protein n=1 Tax=Trichinella nelsoni TaxID=6336 RepID=A0A0V0RWM1_9BILA|nr:hypothetical protein T07_926 [Trichinella nelsoni]